MAYKDKSESIPQSVAETHTVFYGVAPIDSVNNRRLITGGTQTINFNRLYLIYVHLHNIYNISIYISVYMLVVQLYLIYAVSV